MSNTNDIVLDLNFVPAWARQPADKNPYVDFERRHHDRRDDRDSRRSSPQPKRAPERSRRESVDKRREFSPREDNKPDRFNNPRPEHKPVPVDISFIPERKGLKPLAARLSKTGRAWPLLEVASLFLSKPEFYAVKLEVVEAGEGTPAQPLCQCVECKAVFLDKTLALAHLLQKHFPLFYDQEDIQGEPPKGTFPCVAKCGLSGELLGPPNYHGYNDKVQELHRTRYSHLSLEEYRKHIINETNPELLEQWKQAATHQTLYKTKRLSEPLTFNRRLQAEDHFLTHYAPSLIQESKRFIVPGIVSVEPDDPRLQRAIREAWNRENRFPLKMAIAIHPAFRHLGLNIFKTPDRATFVTAVRPHAIDPALTTDEVRQILECLHITPGLNRQELVLKLNPGVPADAPGITGMMQALRWLVDKGHVIEFFNGKLAVPARRMSGAPEPKATELPDAQPPPSETPSMPRSDAATSPAKGATDQHQPQGAQGV